jgi:hypothetical protein
MVFRKHVVNLIHIRLPYNTHIKLYGNIHFMVDENTNKVSRTERVI